jgi:hypothetical protein
VDAGGLGSGIADRLAELGYPVSRILFGERAIEEDLYAIRKDEMAGELKKWFEDQPNQLPNDEALKSDISSPSYTYDSSRRLKVESKEAMKRRGLKSPDGFDMLCLTLRCRPSGRQAPEPQPGAAELEGDVMTVDRLDKFLYEIRLQPMWRREADLDAEYYDGNQLDHATLDDMQRLGHGAAHPQPDPPTIDVALGMEAKTRSDWRVQADDEKYQDVAEAMSVKLKEAERESRADRACSDAYAGQLKTGLGWVEVSREMDPFKYPYRVSSVSRREIFWDWRAKEPDLSDARYLVRRRWQDVDILELMFPDQKEMVQGWAGRRRTGIRRSPTSRRSRGGPGCTSATSRSRSRTGATRRASACACTRSGIGSGPAAS